ncbi:MAG TPA: hypothetical protein VLV32_01035 [Burkholderiales bacterium]|nr:hypothetical protein [Burkholderiales bacterium]
MQSTNPEVDLLGDSIAGEEQRTEGVAKQLNTTYVKYFYANANLRCKLLGVEVRRSGQNPI